MIADGDSNVYLKVLQSRPYDNLTVEKIECINHLLRNLRNKLTDLSKDCKNGYNIQFRKLLGENVLRLRNAVQKAAKHWKNTTIGNKDQIENLRRDIINAPYHVFGSHKDCETYFCPPDKRAGDTNLVEMMTKDGFFYKIQECFVKIADNTESLLHTANNNAVEHLNSQIAKYIGGKRINYCLRGSYQMRCHEAVVAHNSSSPHASLHHSLVSCSPGKYAKKRETTNARKVEKARQRSRKRPGRNIFCKQANDVKAYGCLVEKPDLDILTYEGKKSRFLQSLILSEQQKIALEMVNQSESRMWLEERRKRLTASNFGEVCRRREGTSCQRLVKTLLYSNFRNIDTDYGSKNEKLAILKIEEEKGIKVKKCGLFIDPEFNFLGASPDGLIEGESGLVEVKCPSTAEKLNPSEFLTEKKKNMLFIDQHNNVTVNKQHKHYYQVQGQLRVTQRNFCLFGIWSPVGIVIHQIERDDNFWKDCMENHLVRFYEDCLLPELVDPRHPRSMAIRDPPYIIQAQEKKKATKKRKIIV